MTLDEYFKKNGLSLNGNSDSVYQKGMTLEEYHQAVKMKPFNNLISNTNDLISSYNNRTTANYEKYGDYSSHIKQYEHFASSANNLLKQLDGFRELISEDEYKKISETLSSIASTVDTQKKNIQGIIDFYSSFEDENQYKTWETDNRLYAEHGDLTAENVDYFMCTMEKRKANGELNGYEQEFYDWIMHYDLTRGYKDKEYYDQRIALLEDRKSKLEEQKGIVWDKPVAGQDEINQQIREIEGRIGDMKYLRNQLDRENVYEDKGYSLHKGAVDFEDKAKAYETSFATPLPADGSKDRLRVKDVKDKVIFAYQNKEVFVEGFFDSNIGWRKYAVSQEEANKIQEEWHKYTFLTPDEFSTYCYLKKNDKEQGTNSADKFMSDMEMTLDMRKTNAANDKIREDMNADSFKGAFATGFYNVLSVPATVLGGLQALPSAAVSLAKGEDINIYSNSFQISNFAQSVRTTTGEMIDSKGWNLVYNAVMSTADSLFAAAVFKGAAPYILATSAATSRMKELVLQGASDGEIIMGSLASGLIEVVTEKISIDRLFGGDIKPTTFKQFIKEGLTQAAVEGSEEVASEVLNNISDEMLRGSMSDYNQAIRRYEAQGLSRSEATKKAANDVLVQIFEAALSGMISGGIGGLVAGGSQMHKFKVIGDNILKGGNVDTVLTAAEYLGTLNPEIKGQVKALNHYNKSGKNGKTNAAYKRTLGKVAATVSENVTEVKQSVTEKSVSSELRNRKIDNKTIDKVSKIVGKYLSGQKLSSSEQGYLQHNSVAATVMNEIEAAQEQVKTGSLPQSPTATAPSSDGANAQSTAAQWAVDLVNKLTTIDSAMSVINISVNGKSAENTGNSDVNRMIKILSIASGKTTAEQEAEAGDIPYSQYIREKEAAEKEAAEKQNTAENSGESSPMENVDGENVITTDMPEGERAEILENTTIEVVEYDSENSPLSDQTIEELKSTYKSKAQGILKALCEKFGIFKDYSNDNVSLKFNYSRGSLNESVHKQNERGSDFSDFAKMLSLFDHIVSNAQPIECHSDKYVETHREDRNLKRVYVLLSAFKDGNNIIPIELSIKEFKSNDKNKLYVSVTMKKIEADLMETPPNAERSTKISKSTSMIETDLMGTPSEQNSSYRIPKSTSTYSLPQIIENINPSDGDFLKYIPDELLNEEQLQSKKETLEREETRLEEMKNDYLRSTVSEETVAKRKKSVEKLTKLFGLGLEWSESVKRGKYNPNSRTVVLNPNLTLREMYIEVLKHEFTHDLENRKLYKKFKNFLFESSKSFIEFCEQRIKVLTGETIKGKDAVYALRGEIYIAYKKSKELTEDERHAFNRESAEREMVCDFVAKKLLAEENEEAAIKALTELAENQPTIWERFTQWLRDILFKIKHNHNKTDSAQEIEYLERLLKRVYDSKVDKKKTTLDGINKHSFEGYAEDGKGNKYTYESLISKPDMEITTVDDSAEYTPTAESRKNVVNEAVKNAASVGRINENGNAVVYVEDIDTEIVVSKNGLRHGLDRRFEIVAPVTLEVGEILTHSIRINELIPKNENVSKSYVLMGVAKNSKNEPYIVSFVINRATNEISSIDVLYSVNTKTEPVGSLSPSGFVNNTSYFTDSTISISDLLDLVNRYFPDVLPEDVLRHYGHTSRPDGEIGKSALYSIDMETAAEADITEIPDQMAVIADRYKRGELSDEDYRIEVQDLLMRANEKYGPIEQGEKAENKTPIPKRVTSNKSEKTKRWVRTVHESGILPEDMEVELDATILKDALSYEIIGDKAAQAQANAAIQRGTAVREWEAAVNGDGIVGKRTIAIGETLLKLAAERKDNRTVMKLIAEVSEMGTRAGQVVQAMSMLKKMDGVGQLYYVQKSVERINRDLDKRFARKLKKGKLDSIPQVKINETLANQLAASKTKEDFEVTYEAMIQSIADQVPTTFLDKWNAWRYFAMLFNPRTHIRNILGNDSFVPTIRFKDLLAASAEKILLGEEQRTKSAIVKKEYREFALGDFSNVEDIIAGGGKMNPSDEIRDKQNIFDTKWLEKLRKWNFDKLEQEDKYFLKKHYAHALGGFLQARNIDITKEIDSGVMEEARKYAMEEAHKATYRDASIIVNVLQRASRTKSNVWNSIVEGVLPFKKTPINIVKRGIEYSPIGLIKTLTKGTYDLVNENITLSQYIDGIAGGLTGTGITLLGMLLSSLGFIKITGGFDDDEEDDLNRLLGRQEYAVEIAGHSFTVDWMAPVCIPFFMGVEIQKAIEESGNGNLWQSIKNVSGNALEPIINLSMLSGMQDIISSARYSEGHAVVGSVLWNIVLSYGSQAVPSIFGATARTIDGTRRTTYIDKTSWMSDMGQMALNKIESKIPGVSMLRSEYVDEFGRTEDSGNVFVRALQNFVLPGYYSKIEDDPVIEELERLYKSTGEGVLPSKPKKYIEVGGKKMHLTADEYEEYAKEVGLDRYDYVREFINSSLYKTLTDAEKQKVISDLYSYAQAKAKTHHSEYKLPNTYAKVYENEKDGMSPVVYYSSSHFTNRDENDTNGNGKVSNKEKLAAIRKMNVSNDIKAALIALYS